MKKLSERLKAVDQTAQDQMVAIYKSNFVGLRMNETEKEPNSIKSDRLRVALEAYSYFYIENEFTPTKKEISEWVKGVSESQGIVSRTQDQQDEKDGFSQKVCDEIAKIVLIN
ncbi:hypothetical protein [Litoribacillus peritrichatus]|uniref:Uncharacterized protein n=1 Tax=Litoribacillus peritrichatus TaxID=718191 RepID=A0ABP7LYD3_9GAMM